MPDVGKESLSSAGHGFFADRADVVVDTALLKEEEWHQYRKMGIGGSDAAAVLNVSPWTSAYSLYLKKCGLPLEKEEEIDVGQQYIFEYGHLMEPMVADMFERITGFKVMIDTFMYRHKKYPFMQANIDRVVEMPDGTLALLECKTTTFFNKESWTNGSVPRYYKLQCQHYMAILDVDVCYIACIYGNTINDFVCRRIDRNLDEERELIAAEKEFWEEHVLPQEAPEFSTHGEIEAAAVYSTLPYADPKKPKMQFDEEFFENIKLWVSLAEKKKQVQTVLESIENEMQLVSLPIRQHMGDVTKGFISHNADIYDIDYSPRSKTLIDNKRLELVYPDVYKDVSKKKLESYRVFSIKKKKVSNK